MRKFKCTIGTITKRRGNPRRERHSRRFVMMPYSVSKIPRSQEKLMDSHEKDRLFQKGLDAFNSAHFYDAHEHWEEVWLETPNPEKMFLQGLIQVAAAFHHYSRANSQGTRNLLRAGLLKLDFFPKEHHGLALEPLRATVRLWLAELEAGENPDHAKIPRIRSHTRGGTSI
jgi:uncharacterized protein